ncbi:hypothetical protein ACEPAH_7578 [Sanghuangporus vaninii]
MSIQGHKYSASLSQNHKAQLANAYNELGKELSSTKIKVVGNYTLGRVIGEGTYGTVRLGTHRLTSTRVAIKQIPKAMSAALTREIHHHRRLHHPHVCKLYEVIATESTIWLVTELCSGGELFDYLAEKGRLSEDESKTIFGQLCLAVAYIHEKSVVHRDLKLENVLLDERCRVKLGDFGFTREFERGALLDTYCGTTGYAAPEMLLGKKYLGPEVDIWSMGIILYCLLTGTLPFDDDDESIMREKIIIGEFDNPDWLSADARDLLAHILQHDPSKRLTIPQILAHPWFSRPPPITAENENEAVSAASATYPISSSTSIPRTSSAEPSNSAHHLPSPSPSTSEASFHSAPSQQSSPLYQQPTSSIITRDESPDESVTMVGVDDMSFDSNASEATVKQQKENGRKHHEKDVAEPASRRKKSTSTKGSGEREDNGKKVSPTLEEEEFPMSGKQPETTRSQDVSFPRSRDPSPSQKPLPSPSFGGQSPASAPPTAYPTRTPARTKRRSVSSILSQPSSPTSDTGDHQHTHFPPQDFAALLRTPAPLLFSTPLERSLLNSLSALGFDIGQMVHSVLSDACDASGAIWWMLKRKAEKKALEAAFEKAAKAKQAEASAGVETEIETELENNGPLNLNQPSPGLAPGSSIPEESLDKIDRAASGTASKSKIDQSHSAPELTFIPPTPTTAATQGDSSRQQQQRKKSTSPPVTPPRSKSPRSYLSPTPTSMDSSKSNPSTPNAKDKDKDSKGRSSNSSGKPRSGSVSIVQRATMTALEAAGLVRKRSAEAVKEKEDKEKERDKEKEKDDRTSSSLDSRNSHHGNGHNGPARLTKSPPIRPVKDHKDNHPLPPLAPPVTPERERTIPTSLPSASPWIPVSRSSTFTAAPPTPANSPGNTNDFGVGEHHHHTKLMGGPLRNRSSLLTTFRMWFNEDRKGKRKASVPPPINITSSNSSSAPGAAGGVPASPRAGGGTRGGTFKRRGVWNGPKPRVKRASISSRRSSSVNSRRSSVASMQMVLMERDSTAPHHTGTGGMVDISRQRSDASRRSFTPNSEAEREVYSSRPSSIRSYSMQNNGTNRHHRKSPSAGSGGSAARYASGGGGRASTSPLKQYHRRAGSSSSTRVIRQARTSSHQSQSQNRPVHVRSNSTTSSIHSLPSSRPGSFYDASEGESRRTDSPFRDDSSRRGGYKNKANTVLLAQKKHTALGVPSAYTSSFMTSVSSSRSSWKKAWGTEPPGWQSRPSQYPVEILAISPAPDQPITIRDVFSGQGRQSLNLNNESDWVDEDEDFPAFAGGLGQIPLNKTSSATRQMSHNYDSHPIVQLSPVPFRGNRNTRRTGRTSNRGGGGGSSGARVRGVAGHSPITGMMPLPGCDGVFDATPVSSVNVNEPRLSRRNLPNGRAHPAFKSAIVEEDEEEEE